MTLPHDGLDLNTQILVLSIREGTPLVYLFDENHDDTRHIYDNIEIAAALCGNANVSLVGVEQYAGGYVFDPGPRMYTGEYLPGDIRLGSNIGETPIFADELHVRGFRVVGVDSEGHSDWVEQGFHSDELVPGERHPAHRERSLHFITTLFQERSRLGMSGNLILNCGCAHNDDIQSLSASVNPPEYFPNVSFVRVRSRHFPGALLF